MKKTITMLIIAALVLAAFSMVYTQSVKADSTSEVRILSYSYYVAPSNTILASEAGDLIIVGEIENVGSNVIANVTLKGIAFGSSAQEFATTTTQAFTYYMEPGQTAPFYLDLNAASSTTNDLSWVSSVTDVTVLVDSVTDATNIYNNSYTIKYPDLIIPAGMEQTYLPGNGTYYAFGTIVNNGTQAAQYPWVVTTFYNLAGKVIGINFTDYLTNSLAPGDAIRFFASPADDTPTLTNEIANYTSIVDCLTLVSSTTLPTAPPNPIVTPSTTTTSTQLPTLPIVVAVVVIIAVVIAVLMLVRKRQETLPPPPPPPPPPMP